MASDASRAARLSLSLMLNTLKINHQNNDLISIISKGPKGFLRERDFGIFMDCLREAYPSQIFVGHWWRGHSVVGVDDGNDVEADQFGDGAHQMASGVFVVEVGFGHQNLAKVAK